MKVKVVCLSLCFLVMVPCFQCHAGQDQYAKARERMVQKDLKGRDITDKKVLSVMGKVKRHLFVEKNLWDVAYNDYPLSIGEGQTISQPYIVALMTQYLNLKPTDRVLEVGTGSAYQAAVLAELVEKVYSIEIKKGLAQKAAARLKELGYNNVTVKQGDGYAGWPEHAPFDAIIVTCAASHIPPPLTAQLNEGGRLIMPVGSTPFYQHLTLITKVKGELIKEQVSGVRFVPMTGEAQNK